MSSSKAQKYACICVKNIRSQKSKTKNEQKQWIRACACVYPINCVKRVRYIRIYFGISVLVSDIFFSSDIRPLVELRLCGLYREKWRSRTHTHTRCIESLVLHMFKTKQKPKTRHFQIGNEINSFRFDAYTLHVCGGDVRSVFQFDLQELIHHRLIYVMLEHHRVMMHTCGCVLCVNRCNSSLQFNRNSFTWFNQIGHNNRFAYNRIIATVCTTQAASVIYERCVVSQSLHVMHSI